MDSTGEVKIPVHNGKHLEFDLIGENFLKYGSIINFAHWKGRTLGGFGAIWRINQLVLLLEMEKLIFIVVVLLPTLVKRGKLVMNLL